MTKEIKYRNITFLLIFAMNNSNKMSDENFYFKGGDSHHFRYNKKGNGSVFKNI